MRSIGGWKRKEVWDKAKELADQGVFLVEAARILKVSHSSLIYIARSMEFSWLSARRLRGCKKLVDRRIERMVALANKIR